MSAENPQPAEDFNNTPEYTADSLYAAFYWLLETSEFADGEPDDEARAIEIGNVYSYALEEGIPYEDIEDLNEAARQALAQMDSRTE
jgi:hypothetical protein